MKLLILNRLKATSERNRNLSILLAVALSVLIIISSNILYINVSKELNDGILLKNGSIDIIATFFKLSKQDIESLVNNDFIKEYTAIQSVTGRVLGDQLVEDVNIYVGNDQFFQMKQIKLLSGSLNHLQDGIIIEKNVADRLNKSVSDSVAFEIEGRPIEGRIIAIVEGLAIEVGQDSMNVFYHQDFYEKNLKEIEYNTLLINSGHTLNKVNKTETLIRSKYKDSVVMSIPYNNFRRIQQDISNLLNNLYILIFIIILLSTVLIYNTYTIIASERMKYWGVLRTLGLRYKKMIKLMLEEVALFSIFGFVFGAIVGIIVGNIICTISGTQISRAWPSISIGIIAFFAAVIPSLLSTLFIGIKLSKNKQPIEMLFSNKAMNIEEKNFGYIELILGIILMVVVVGLDIGRIYLLQLNNLLMVPIAQVFFLIIALILIMPYVIKCFCWLMEGFSNRIIYVASRNMNNNFIRTKGIIIALLITVVLITTSYGSFETFKRSAEEKVQQQLKYDFVIEFDPNEYDSKEIKKQISYLEEINESTILKMDKVKDESGVTLFLGSSNPQEFFNMYNKELLKDGSTEVLADFNKKRDVGILGESFAEMYNIVPGDILTIKFKEETISIEIIDLIDTFEFYGLVLFINDKSSIQGDYATYRLLGTTKAPDSVDSTVEKLKDRLQKENINIYSITDIKDQWRERVVKGIEPVQFIMAVILISVLFMLANTLALTTKERNREFGLLRSIGMRQKSVYKVVFLEGVLLILITICIGIMGSLLSSNYLSEVMGIMSNFSITRTYPIRLFMSLGLLILFVGILFLMYPVSKSLKQEIVDAIKTE